LVLSLCLPATALAHVGGQTHSFTAGALHPLSGLDHLLAMVAVGLLAGGAGGHMRWMVPTGFVASMALGAMLGANAVHVPFIEIGIALSLVVFGSALVVKRPLGAPVLMAMAAAFALFHGHAHGTEMGTGLSAAPYALGFMLATASLHAFGVLLTMRTLLPVSQSRLRALSGGGIAMVGVASLGFLLVAGS